MTNDGKVCRFVGKQEEKYEIIDKLVRDGHSAIVISSETDEIRALCDRVLVMYEGTIAGELALGEVLPERIMAYAAGMGERT